MSERGSNFDGMRSLLDMCDEQRKHVQDVMDVVPRVVKGLFYFLSYISYLYLPFFKQIS